MDIIRVGCLMPPYKGITREDFELLKSKCKEKRIYFIDYEEFEFRRNTKKSNTKTKSDHKKAIDRYYREKYEMLDEKNR